MLFSSFASKCYRWVYAYCLFLPPCDCHGCGAGCLLFVMIYVRGNIPMRPQYLSFYVHVCVGVSSGRNHLTQFIDCAFILFYWSSFNFPTLVVSSWMQSIDVALLFMFLFWCLCATWKKIHPALPSKYSTLNIWFIPENVNGRMSIQLNCCSIGGCTNSSIACQQRRYTKPVRVK